MLAFLFAFVLFVFAVALVVLLRANALEAWERADSALEAVGHPSARAGASRVSLTLRRHGRAVREIWLRKGEAALVLG